MKIIYSDDHRLHDSEYEIAGGQMVYPFERPSRMDFILKELKKRNFNDIMPPQEFGLEPVKKIHTADYIDFLATGFDEWKAQGYKGNMIATGFLARRMGQKRPKSIDGKLGFHCLASETAINKGTWQAAQASKDVILTATDMLLKDGKTVFALCRPPGHHATADMFGGYCFLNNAAISAQYIRDHGAKKVAVLDIDYHHGNGVQDIFYQRGDVLYVSLHCDPLWDYPHFLGHADEVGTGDGKGANRNYPMPPGTQYDVWGASLKDGLQYIKDFGAEVLVLALGTDAFEKDPISQFKLTSPDFTMAGKEVAKLGIPTLVEMEGGYAIDEIGVNVANFLEGIMHG